MFIMFILADHRDFKISGRPEVYITQLRRNAMGVGLVFEANLHTKEIDSVDGKIWREKPCLHGVFPSQSSAGSDRPGAPKHLGPAGRGHDVEWWLLGLVLILGCRCLENGGAGWPSWQQRLGSFSSCLFLLRWLAFLPVFFTVPLLCFSAFCVFFVFPCGNDASPISSRTVKT